MLIICSINIIYYYSIELSQKLPHSFNGKFNTFLMV